MNEVGLCAGKLTLGSGRKKDKARLVRIPDIHSKAAVVWSVQVEDFAAAVWVPCLLGIAQETIAIVEESTNSVLFTTCCQMIIGWSVKQDRCDSSLEREALGESLSCLMLKKNKNYS